ncbi:MAG: hypothetical protein DI582_10745 [Azospirillum brasilense]|nr:MAG: hypothetical protein DI582_10745 [Azospirillum brasilense]
MQPIRHSESSSTKLAAIFSAVLGIAALLLGLEMAAITHGDLMHPMYSKFVLGLIVLACIGLFFISFYVTKRINTIVGTADRIIATGDLTARIPLDGRWDDLSKLSITLNSMLGEIEQLVSGMRTLSDNIAHDLRHPLTRLRNHVETMRSAADPVRDAAMHDQLGELTKECDAILTTFQALLRISNIESGKRHTGMHRMELGQLLRDVVELYEPLAADKQITLTWDDADCSVTGDKDLLFQAFANLVDNAIKYTPAQGRIDIALQPGEDGHARVTIRDTGEGVSDEHKQRVFRRFYRVEHSRHTPGSGLGLSLVAAIIKLHQGQVLLHDNSPRGLVVTVVF